MNLAELHEGLAELYPPLLTLSKAKIKTHALTGELAHGGLSVTIKTLFPPSARRRAELLVTESEGALRVRPEDPTDTAEAQRFAERVRNRWLESDPDGALEPLRLVKDEAGRAAFVVAPRATQGGS
jgi:hypothetical protein